ncbi:MAG: hypothetical protein NC307_12545 [Roseburia sp.]|nr:hypothetical protein [Roseburia sp.]
MNSIPKETLEYINQKKDEYEKRFDITIWMWFIRKSFLRGLERVSSDLDIVFVFSDTEKKKMIFERADRRVEIQCWNMDDVLDILGENKIEAMKNKEFSVYEKEEFFKHYILDYYNGFYCGLDSGLSGYRDGFLEKCREKLWELYEPLVPVKMFYSDLKALLKNLEYGYYVSLNEYLNGIWSGLAGLHLLEKGKPAEVEITELARKYLDKEEYLLSCRLVSYFKKTVQKQSNFLSSREMVKILYDLQEKLEKQMDGYQVNEINAEAVITAIKESLI